MTLETRSLRDTEALMSSSPTVSKSISREPNIDETFANSKLTKTLLCVLL